MQDPRYQQLADVIVGHSCAVQKGEKVIVETFDIPEEFTAVLLSRIHEAGGHAICLTRQNRVLRELYLNGEDEQLAFIGKHERQRMEEEGAVLVRQKEEGGAWYPRDAFRKGAGGD